jgi:hypothetical protein
MLTENEKHTGAWACTGSSVQLNWCPARRHGKVVTGAQNCTAVTSSRGRSNLVKEGQREKVAMEHHKQHDKAPSRVYEIKLLGFAARAACCMTFV